MNGLWAATLMSNSQNYEFWRSVFEGNDVPLASPNEFLAQLGDELNVPCYKLAWERMTPAARTRLVDGVARKLGADPAEIRLQCEIQGFPIRKADIAVAFSLRAFV